MDRSSGGHGLRSPFLSFALRITNEEILLKLTASAMQGFDFKVQSSTSSASAVASTSEPAVGRREEYHKTTDVYRKKRVYER
ncbi:hypothetical protein BC829DRAFT_443219 [Chytridium lagenaria]|nr:hypothetical protein BC829DRAFT_443219 [Chytridium lagenaria]